MATVSLNAGLHEDAGHATAALLIQVETGQFIFANPV